MLGQATGVCYGGAMNREPQATDQLYARALARGRWGLFKSMLTGRPRCLLDLAGVEGNCLVSARRDVGLQTVPIDQIRGSENRVADFDSSFNPLQDHTRDRWLSIATAWHRGRVLPPVSLVQVGDVYFVRDGHHRISVARALGQRFVEGRVLVCDVDGPLPWNRQPQAPGPVRARSHADPRTPTGGSRPASILDWLSGIVQPAESARENKGAS